MNRSESAKSERAESFVLDESALAASPTETVWRFQSVPRLILGHRLTVVGIFSALGLLSARFALTETPRVASVQFVALLGGGAILMEPFLGVLGYYVLAFLRPQDLFWGFGSARLTMLVSVSTLAAAGLHFAYRPNLQCLKGARTLLIAVLWLSIFASTQLGRFGDPETKWMSYYNKLFLIYFVVLTVMNSERKIQALVWMITLSVGYLAWWANEQYYFRGMSVVHGPGKSGSTLYDHNDFAMLIVMTLPSMWYLMRERKNDLVKFGLLGLLPLAAHAIMVTFTRGGFLGMVATFGVILYRERNKKLVTAIVLLGVAFFAIFAGEKYKERIASIDDYKEERSASGRLEAWDVGLRMMKYNPFFGVGLRQFTTGFPHYSNFEPRVAHNSWVQLGAECGVIAVGSYGLLVVLTVLSLRRIRRRLPLLEEARRREIGMLASISEATLVGYLVCGFFLSMEDFEFFYLVVAIVQVLDRLSERRLEEARAEVPPLPESAS